ncbi:VOC family protein [Effusibacillus pohliae]|uniref:VOC family protein n=1 Tax=Effusibacillus pohliae TaxID=232270 RepID=UPI00037E30AF|nr:VOC family protein [Effusibacillus pohliae]
MKHSEPEIKGLHAVVLIVKDLQKQKRFYQEVLNLQLEADYGDAVFFRCGNQKIALFAHSHHPEGSKRLAGAEKGISHLEFRIKREDREHWDRKLREVGFHAYGDNYEDEDGNLFHFVYE